MSTMCSDGTLMYFSNKKEKNVKKKKKREFSLLIHSIHRKNKIYSTQCADDRPSKRVCAFACTEFQPRKMIKFCPSASNDVHICIEENKHIWTLKKKVVNDRIMIKQNVDITYETNFISYGTYQ